MTEGFARPPHASPHTPHEIQNPAFLIRSTASANRSFVVQTVILIYPSPGAPNPLPGVVTIPAFSSKWAVNEAEVYPLGTVTQM